MMLGSREVDSAVGADSAVRAAVAAVEDSVAEER
jgi:hypothetical protein